MATRLKLRTKREIVLPAKTGSIVVTFRTRKHKGAIKNIRKVYVPRGAEQVNVRLKRGTVNGSRRTAATTKKTTAKPAVAKKKTVSHKPQPAVSSRPSTATIAPARAKQQTFSEPLPAAVLRAMYACTADKYDKHDGLKGIYYDKRNGNAVASDGKILVCLPAQINTERIMDKKGNIITANFPQYLHLIPPVADLSWTRISNVPTDAWAKLLKDVIARSPKGERVLVKYGAIRRHTLTLDAKQLLKAVNFLAASGCKTVTAFSHDETHPLILRPVEGNPLHLALVMPVSDGGNLHATTLTY
ncbi:MAG: hypothetical protein LBU42_10060 [Prevotellaceae bacterium]|jgi:hypothetical protein|nr:hypothetical protein [Prevotellaceae bacterium]